MSTLYQQQLNYVFDRPVTEPAWYWQARDDDEEEAISPNAETLKELLEQEQKEEGEKQQQLVTDKDTYIYKQ